MAEKYLLDFEKKLKKSNDHHRKEVDSGTMDEVSVLSQETKSNKGTIREELLENRSWFKRILNWQNLRKNQISIVKRR
jgi:hypothetical protein